MTPDQMPESSSSPGNTAEYAPVAQRRSRAKVLARFFYMALLCVLLVPLLSALLPSLVGSVRPGSIRDGKGYARAWTMNHLSAICRTIDFIEYDSKPKDPPPTTLPELVDWIGVNFGHDRARYLEIDLQNKVITDFWKQPVRLIVRDGKLEALGSTGDNKIWEYGQGDDIVVRLDGCRARRQEKESQH